MRETCLATLDFAGTVASVDPFLAASFCYGTLTLLACQLRV